MSFSDSLAAPAASSPASALSDLPRWAGVALVVLLALVFPVGFAGSEGEAVVAAVGGAIVLPFVLRPKAPALGVGLLAALAVWAAVSFAWSPLIGDLGAVHRYKDLEALTAPKLLLQALLYCAFVYGTFRLPPDQRRLALTVGAALLALLVAVLMIEGIEGGRIYGALNGWIHHRAMRPDLARRDAARGAYVAVLLFWPLALATWRKVPPALPCLVAAVLLVDAFLLGVDAPAAAMGVSALVFVGVGAWPRLGPMLMAAATTLYLLGAPLAFRPHGPAPADLPTSVGKASWRIRLGIWRFASGLIVRKPLQGYGLDASRTYPDQIPMHPHDAALQLWLETGAPGAVLAVLFWAWLFLRIRASGRDDPAWTAAACATASVYLLVGAISFGVWQEWWLALGAIATACCGLILFLRREAAAVQHAGELVSLS